ncbi:transglutaminase-like enzyme, predicted cysteine protease [Burkholderiales bacterium JOSHI_001]|nr:transglutaminase-like enzyme, predicted cysteine protease [Burkholderiales bacterium JOSHI_001]
MIDTTQRLLPRWPGWAALPREARDTLFLLGVIGWTVLPHLTHLPLWCGALTALVLAWRAHLAVSNANLPGRASVVMVLVVAAGLTLWSERTLLGKDAGVTMLVVLMALKTLELRARRDALVVFFLGFFLVLTHFLYSQSLITALAMLVSVWGLLTALVLAHMPVGRPALKQAGGLALRSALLGAPIMVLLFLLFPRFAPLWGVPGDAGGRTGLSGTMELGNVADLANDDSIAFRIRFLDGNAPPPQALYFRGPVLNRFDGLQWSSDHNQRAGLGRWADAAPQVQTAGAAVRYEMTLEPIRQPLLPLLEATPLRADALPRVPGWMLTPGPDLTWRTDRIVSERLRFSATAWPSFRYGQQVPLMALRDAVRLPSGFNPRSLAWAAELRRDPRYATADGRTLAQALLAHIRTGGYTYTLSPGTYGTQSIDEFWLDRKQGFCEHFAASFVVLMRAMDIPARVVTGYQGTDPEPVDGYHVVRQSHAHAWAEYWQAEDGWVRVDPTAAVAPDRVVRSRSLPPVPGLVAEALGTVSPELLAHLREGWESMNNRWNQWVLSYSRTQQFDLLSRLGVKAPDWTDLGRVLVLLLAAGALAGVAWASWDRHRQDPWARLQRRVRERLARLGLAAQPHQTPRALADLVRRCLGEDAQALAQQLDGLDRARYGQGSLRRPDPAWWSAFAREADRLAAAARGTRSG